MLLQYLDEGVNHQDKEQWREGIALDDAVRQADFTDCFLRPLREADLPPSHHLNDEALDADGESVHLEERLQKAVVHIVIGFLEVVVELYDFFLSASSSWRPDSR